MKKIALIIALSAISTAAIADSANNGTGSTVTTSGTATVDTVATSTNNGNNQGVTIIQEGAEAPDQASGRSTDPLTSRSTGFNQVEYSGSYDVRNVPPVSAPALTTTLSETCMGSTSAGAGWTGMGISFGTTWRDGACVRRLDSRQMASLGYPLVGKELMCDSKAVRKAAKRAGRPCYDDLPPQHKRPEDRKVEPVAVQETTPALGGVAVDRSLLRRGFNNK
jgi:hypothetical protein